MDRNFCIAVHGGAGTILRSRMNPDLEVVYRLALTDAVDQAYALLDNGGSAVDAVEIAVRILEDCPLFNAGRGAVFTHDGSHELDASIMSGRDGSAGAVSGLRHIANPVSLARAVMEHSPHVLLAGSGAEIFASEMGFPMVEQSYFYTEERYQQWLAIKDTGKIELDHTPENALGTVGAVALDREGNLAAATSTGGMTNKSHGRVGDTPIIGAGTYASNGSCAVSCTGHGEFFIRNVVAYDVACLMNYAGQSLQEACENVVMKKLLEQGGEGGLIAVDSKGNISIVFNSEGMYRACRGNGSETIVGIYRD